ncbi:winged helix-turn-helix domain-containing protein [Schaalia canis]|uniref:Transcriptional regulator n=1 Tax=Schaalia canis TaxID=100469 RepID=A0A3P1SC06_9ACTO|nr:transcriptional regulator [Schaalia canis]RRC94589.1 transcriptional regulator [Schaalia canis]
MAKETTPALTPGEAAAHEGHPRLALDDKLLNPLRLSIVSALVARDSVSFKDMREFIQTTDSTLSKNASALEECGYVTIIKQFIGTRPHTSLSLTKQGRQAWERHIAALQAIASAGEQQ